MDSAAYFSEDRKFRYWLTRVWDVKKDLLCVFGVNPSTADEKKDDATIRKDIGFAQRLGFGGVLKLNVGAYRATDPRQWRQASDPFGPENSANHLAGYAARFKVGIVVAAWGKNGAYAPSQCRAICDVFPNLWCWGTNKDGTPVHPLMLAYSTPLQQFQPGAGE